MIALLLAGILSATPMQVQATFDGLQIERNNEEFEMSKRLRADQDAIDDIWRPSPQLLSDIRAARRCYTQFHLYKVDSCKDELDRVDHDLDLTKGEQ